MNKKIILLALSLLLVLAGCGDPLTTDKEVYMVGWLLHNLDDSYDTTLEPDTDEYGNYTFDYNLPGKSPMNYDSCLWYVSPNQDAASCGLVDVAAPSRQTFYTYTYNPVAENYDRDFSFERYIELNNLKGWDYQSQLAFDWASSENIIDNLWYSPYPANNDKKEFSFGGPFLPCSIQTEETWVHLRNHFLNGLGGSYLERSTEMTVTEVFTGEESTVEFEKPSYKVYRDGSLIRQEELVTYYGAWAQDYFNDYLYGTAKYVYVIEVPSYYQIFNKTIVRAEIYSGNEDKDPPWLKELNIQESYSEGEGIELGFTAEDNDEVVSSSAYYKVDKGSWQNIPLSRSEDHFSGTIIGGGDEISLRIKIVDKSGNNQSYEIYPVSLRQRELMLDISQDKEILSPGTVVNLNGLLADGSGEGTGFMMMDFYHNDEMIGRTYTSKPSWDYDTAEYFEGGRFDYDLEVPYDLEQGDSLKIHYGGTGTYDNYVYDITGTQVFDKDLAVKGLELPLVVYYGDNDVDVNVANVGREHLDGKLQLYYAESYHPDTMPEMSMIDEKDISLDAGQESTLSFTVPVSDNYVKISAAIVSDDDENNNNNEKYEIKRSYVYTDVGIDDLYVRSPLRVNETGTIKFTLKNYGVASVDNVSYFVEYSSYAELTNDDDEAIEEDASEEEDSDDGYTLLDQGMIDKLQITQSVEKKINFAFSEEGDYRIRVRVVAENDAYSGNDEQETYVYVKPNGPDVSIDMPYDPEPKVLNQGFDQYFTVENQGNEPAENVHYELYWVNYSKEKYKEDQYFLITSGNLDLLDPGQALQLNAFFVPQMKGDLDLYANVSSDNDIFESNNDDFESIDVLNPGRDVAIRYISAYDLFVGKQSTVYVSLNDLGTNRTENVDVLLYDDGGLVDTISVEMNYRSSSARFNYVPDKPGDVTLRAVADVADDVDESDNSYEENYSVIQLKNITLELTDPDGNDIERLIYTGREEIDIDSSPVNMEVYENGVFGILKYLDSNKENYAAFTIYDALYDDTEKIISDYHESISQDGMDYFTVFVNNYTFDSLTNLSYCSLRLDRDYIESIGIDFTEIEDYSLFYCSKFDFENQECSSEWIIPAMVNFYSGSDYLGVYARNYEKTEAFALSKKDDFDGNTTDIDNSDDTVNPFILEKRRFGMIEFKESVDVSRIKDNMDLLRNNVDISQRKLGIDTHNLPELDNKDATLTFRNVQFTNPKVLRNGQQCDSSICTGSYYDKDNAELKVNVTGFSDYEVIEGYVPPPPPPGTPPDDDTGGDSDDDTTTDNIVTYSGGGGGYINTWRCPDVWEPCQADGKQVRTCTHISGYATRDEERDCTYNPCTNGKKDTGETDIDCGGSCIKCANGKKCKTDNDCTNKCNPTTKVCYSEAIQTQEPAQIPQPESSCDDGIKNQDEEGIDCGGSCEPCKNTNLGRNLLIWILGLVLAILFAVYGFRVLAGKSHEEAVAEDTNIMENIVNCQAEIQRGEIEPAKEDYKKVMGMYNNLTKEQQKQYYPAIVDLYNGLKPKENFNISMFEKQLSTARQLVQAGKIKDALEVYSMLRDSFDHLPKEAKAKYYSDMNALYGSLSRKY